MLLTKMGEGSFRGVPFLIEQEQTESGGRRLVKHEYPLRDDGLTEDLGQALKSYQVNCLVIGENHLQQAQQLINALITPGKGTLVHPYFESMDVFVESYTVSHSTDHQRVSRFSMTFCPALDRIAPTIRQNTQAQAINALETLTHEATVQFDHKLAQVSKDLNAVNRTLSVVELVIMTLNDFMSNVQSVLFNKSLFSLAQRIQPLKNEQLSQVMIEALRTIDGQSQSSMLRYLSFNYAETSVQLHSFKGIKNSLKQQVNLFLNTVLIADLAVNAVKSLNQYSAMSDASAKIDMLDEHLEKLAIWHGNNGNWLLYETVQKTQIALMTDLRQRATSLPNAISVIPTDTIPALVVGHRYASDAGQWLQITQRNHIAHPLFCIGSQQIEVII